MADEKKIDAQFRNAEGKPVKAVAVNGTPEMFSQDVTLDDGTVLRVRVLINAIFRLEGVTDELGQPVYYVQSNILPAVRKAGGGS